MIPPLHIVLHNPQIPQNTGNIGRMCAIIGASLHLVHPLGFTITDAKLKRAGMDYWHSLDIHNHESWDAFKLKNIAPLSRTWLLTTKAENTIWDCEFNFGDCLVFGSEDRGSPEYLHEDLKMTRIKIPQFNDSLRSLNLSTSAGIVAYEAMRQISKKI